MRADGVKIHFDEARGHAPADAELRDDRQVARSSGVRLHLRDRRQPQGQRRRPRAEGRGPHDVPDRQERRQGPLLRDAGQPAQPLGRRPPSPRRPLRSLEHDARARPSESPSRSTSSRSSHDPEAKVELSIHDEDLREGVVEKVRMPIVGRSRSHRPGAITGQSRRRRRFSTSRRLGARLRASARRDRGDGHRDRRTGT